MNIEQLHSVFLNCNKVNTDTRSIESGDLFFALKGANFNGNTFAQKAIEKGAKYAVIDEKEYQTANTILVENTLETLQKLATFHRNYLNIPIIALTGSNGKTTTKELINAVLSQKFKTTATLGNLNNHIGVPLTLLSMNKSTEIGIVEMGANHLNEIAALCAIAQPNYGYITNFGKAHLEGFGGIDGVIKGKSELYDYLKAHQKTIFVNTDDAIQTKKTINYTPVITFGTTADNTFSIQLLNAKPFVEIQYNKLTIKSKLIGTYNFKNISAAICIGSHFKISDTAIKKGIETYTPSNNRSQIITKGTVKIILDAYNANPSSMKVALENFAQLNAPNKLAILGDMFELGNASKKEHQHIADLCKSLKLETILVGEYFFNTTTNFKRYKTFSDLKNNLKNSATTLLIKGSRGMALERLLNFL